MPEAHMIRTLRFRATHHYGRRDWSDQHNAAVFGGNTRPHAHTWEVSARIGGPLDPDTGFVTDLGALDRALDDLVGSWEGAHLNEVIPEVREGVVQPSTERLAQWIFERLAPRVAEPARLESVRVAESPDLAAEYPA